MFSDWMPDMIRHSMRKAYHETGRVYNLGSDVPALANLRAIKFYSLLSLSAGCYHLSRSMKEMM
jgi:hypothetical protein